MQGNPGLREKVHIWLGSLHAAYYIYCLCDDCFFCLFIKKCCMCTCWKKWRPFFIFLGQKWFVKVFFGKIGRIKKKFYKWRLSFFYLDGPFLWPDDLQKSCREHWPQVICVSVDLKSASALLRQICTAIVI